MTDDQHRRFYPSMSEVVAKEKAAEEVRRRANHAEITRVAWFNAHPGKTVEDYEAEAGTKGV